MNIFAILPAFNAEKTLEQTLQAIPFDAVQEVIVVDDRSTDKTLEVAQSIAVDLKINPTKYPFKKMHIFSHDTNRGYGGNQKTCYRKALELGADIVIMIHPDYQYDPKLIPLFTECIVSKRADIVLGSRIRSRAEALAGGMPLYKYIFNRMLTLAENAVSGLNLSEWHTGMRMYSRQVLETIQFDKLSEDFVFDTQFLFEGVKHGFTFGEIPVPVKYFKEASSINFKRSVIYGYGTIVCMLAFCVWKVKNMKF